MNQFNAADRAAVRQRVPIENLAPVYVGKWRRRGREFTGLCPFHHERTPSFTVVPGKRFFHCFGCGAHGDVVDFYMAIEGVTFPDAMQRLLERGGLTSEAALVRAREHARLAEMRAGAEEHRERARRHHKAANRWQRTVAGAGTIVESYLREARRIDIERLGGLPADLRFDPCALYDVDDDGVATEGAAMVAAIRDIAGAVTAVHVTWLKPDGSGKAALVPPKKIFGPWIGGAIRLSAPAPAHERDTLLVGEGIESSLSGALELGTPSADWGVWAAGTLDNLCGYGLGCGPRRPKSDARYDPYARATWHLPSPRPDPRRAGMRLPQGARTVVLLRENDSNDPRAYELRLQRAMRRFEAEGRNVLIGDPGIVGDYNDLLKERAA
jgi:hypothetical protein